MMRAIAFVTDLMFASNIESTLRRAGYEVAVLEDLAALEREMASTEPAVVILDLHAGVEATEVVARAGRTPVLAFGRHTEPALLRSAREAGCAEVVPRSTFVTEMLELVRGLERQAL
jgi:DNA-binding NarL/FixJ family response regulator